MVARNGQISPIGIDLGSSHVKLSQLRRQGGPDRARWLVQRMAEREAALRCDGDFLEKNRDLYAALLKSLRADHGFRGRNAAMLLPGSEVDIRCVRVPAGTPDEVTRRVAAELEGSLGTPAGELVFDCWPVGQVEQTGDTRVELVAVSIPRGRVLLYLDILKRAGLRPVAVDVSPCALARTMQVGREQPQGTVGILDIGRSATLMGIIQSGRVVFGRGIPLTRKDLEEEDLVAPPAPPVAAPLAPPAAAGQALTGGATEAAAEAASTAKKAPRRRSTRKKADAAAPPPPPPVGKPAPPPAVARPPTVLDRLVGEVNRCLKYLRSLPHIDIVQRIVLFGGGATLAGLAGQLREGLGMPVEIGLALDDETAQAVEPAVAAVFGSSIGAALWGLQEASNG